MHLVRYLRSFQWRKLSAAGFRLRHHSRWDEHGTYVSQLENTVPVILSLWTNTLCTSTAGSAMAIG
jgi:hypothetical protein